MNGRGKLSTRHLERLAVVYVRQSSLRQVMENRESTARQYALREHALSLGWPAERIVTLDADLGMSGAATGARQGFEQLKQEVAHGRVGAVFGLEVSRFARNAVDWFQLLDWCRATDTLLIEGDQVYAPARHDDGLILSILCRAVHNMPYVGHVVMLGSMRELLSESLLAQNYMT